MTDVLDLGLTEQQHLERSGRWVEFLRRAREESGYLDQLELVAKFSVLAIEGFHQSTVFRELLWSQQNRMLHFYHDIVDDSVFVYSDPDNYGNTEVVCETEALKTRQCYVFNLLNSRGIISLDFVVA